ncbi:MAG: methyltransferase type 11 [Candidatus Riflebacteria bacterium HGW-Riflebacteria-1]|jgi:SAM-dependent methyltransferase|nr:MAG: methyltransferase type 11 [Candidatus Riflebacteria bacterium HGW-Riflebacteria-1]
MGTLLNKLNLGCGEFKKAGYINVDCFSVSQPDICHDLNTFPYPFADNSFELIEADHLLEHLNDPFMVMRELYRIAADGCQIKLRMPHFSRGFTHAQHCRGFDVSFPLYFNPNFPGGYQGVPLKLHKMTLRWFAQPYLKKRVLPPLFYYAGRTLGRIIDFFANLSPFVCSRLWCFWVGGFEEIEIVFTVEKAS